MDGANPVFHMTSDVKTQAELKAGPLSTTVFHSDLPYVLAREQFEISSYSTWSGSDGGRKFAIPSELITFRTANPDLAYLLVLEDSSGSSWIQTPVVNVRGMYFKYSYNSSTHFNEVVSCINGGDYQVAYTSSDTELQDLTKNVLHGTLSWTFRTWDPTDTSVTVFKTPMTRTAYDDQIFVNHGFPAIYHDLSPLEWMTQPNVKGGTDLESSGLDVVKVRFVFLNITHSDTTFELQKDFLADDISISPTEFRVNDIDLALMAPLMSHGNKANSSVITPLSTGEVVCGKVIGQNLTSAKINTSNTLTGGAAPVLEIPAAVASLTGWDINFSTREIKRNSATIWDDTIAASAVLALGSKEIVFNPSMTLTDGTINSTYSTTDTGSFSGLVNADTVYLASIISGTDKLHSISLFGIGDNMVADLIVGEFSTFSPATRWANDVKIYINISSTGVTTVKLWARNGRNKPNQAFSSYFNVASVNITMPDFTIRLIAIGD
jgi:hypothetical protein